MSQTINTVTAIHYDKSMKHSSTKPYPPLANGVFKRDIGKRHNIRTSCKTTALQRKDHRTSEWTISLQRDHRTPASQSHLRVLYVYRYKELF